MDIRVLLIDGLNVLRRVYEAQPDKGSPASSDHSVDGSLGIIRKIRSAVEPTHLLWVFDGEPPTWRHDLYPQYKANRPPTPQGVKDAATKLGPALTRAGMAHLGVANTEADDAIATIARKLDINNIDTVIASTDQGYCQLLTKHINLYNHVKKEFRNDHWVNEHFKVPVNLYTALIALAGSASDNIHGIPGIGIKTAANLLIKYGSINAILDASETLPAKTRSALLSHGSELDRYLKLVTLRDDIQITLNLKEMRLDV
ncbi:MAG TPA: hypothetical protein ENI80_06795 [Acidiferrobacteraceae bacterium]|nr:hypothetical protein [Acidiferrobacteraceae bacterium]